jgi:monoamine oxidase
VTCCLDLTWQVIVTRWGSDPFALGSYAMMPPGSSPDDMAALAAPVGDVLFFAGEAMSLSNQGTVHGAYATGRDAAAAVIAVHQRRQQQRQHSEQQKEQQPQKEQQLKSC